MGTAPSRLVPKTKEGLKNYVDEYSDEYDDEGTVMHMTAHTPQFVQRARAILVKVFGKFDEVVKSRIAMKGNVRHFNAADQARLESAGLPSDSRFFSLASSASRRSCKMPGGT